MTLELFVVMTADGKIRYTKAGTACAYRSAKTAQRVATGDGDTVVVAKIDMETLPLFIRGAVVVP